MYIGTVLLGRSEDQFWSMTLRKLMALYEEHKSCNGIEEESASEKETFIDNIF